MAPRCLPRPGYRRAKLDIVVLGGESELIRSRMVGHTYLKTAEAVIEGSDGSVARHPTRIWCRRDVATHPDFAYTA